PKLDHQDEELLLAIDRATERDGVDPYIDLLCDFTGDPFASVALDPAHINLEARSVAEAAYDKRAPRIGHLDTARLAVLSDALDEAGCPEAAIRSHLRSPGPHVRGCWALDLVLGKQ